MAVTSVSSIAQGTDSRQHRGVFELSSLIHDMDALIRAIRGKQKPDTEWKAFAQTHRLRGRTFHEISKLWKEEGGERKED